MRICGQEDLRGLSVCEEKAQKVTAQSQEKQGQEATFSALIHKDTFRVCPDALL